MSWEIPWYGLIRKAENKSLTNSGQFTKHNCCSVIHALPQLLQKLPSIIGSPDHLHQSPRPLGPLQNILQISARLPPTNHLCFQFILLP
eukprot:6780393-Prorocentrum_lima.AAC.1